MMTKEAFLNIMGRGGLMPIFTHSDPEVACQMVDIAVKGGVNNFEFTNRTSNALEVFRVLRAHLSAHHPGVILGAGTLYTVQDIEDYQEAGADFFVAPILSEQVGRFCSEKGLIWIPGCGSITEVYHAMIWGATIVKIYPANVLGPGFLKAVLAVLPKVSLMPTGGVAPNAENINSWMEAGAHCVGMGSQLFDGEAMAKRDFVTVENRIKDILALVKKKQS
jgi:2-dehydro-3-deoxyphosphogluconate aldolase/(4S)-4-hydroxy-2-oxoglutarate aldolase